MSQAGAPASGSQSARLPARNLPQRTNTELAQQAVLDRTFANTQAAAQTLSFIQNAKRKIQQRWEEERLATWTAGNHDSSSFFQRMGASLAEGERALTNCQLATKDSSARQAQEKVNLDIIRSNVEAFKSSSQLSQSFFERDSTGGNRHNPNRPGTVTMPQFLKHLQAPTPKSAEASEHVQEEETQSAEFLTAPGTSDLEQQTHWIENNVEMPPPLPGEQDALQDHEQFEVDSVAGFGEEERSRSNGPSKALSHKSTRLDSSSMDDSEGSDDEKKEDKPKPPILKFRAQCNFSTEFKSEERVQRERAQREARKAAEEERLRIQGGNDKVDDINLAWVNKFFAFEVETENQYHGAFPLIVLFMIDNIYPKKVRWHQVDWNAGYQHAYHRNHALLEKIWNEINMDKLRDFRLDPITARIENTVHQTCAEKLLFLKTLKRWFDQRVRHSEMYDPILRRTQIDHAVRVQGRYVRFPAWMKYDQQAIEHARRQTIQNARLAKKMTMTASDWDEMPEFKRLILFLGSADHTRL